MASSRDRLLQSAQALMQQGQLDRALGELQRLLAAEPQDVHTRLRIGDLQVRQGNRAAALDTYLQVAGHHVAAGALQKAVAVYKQAQQLSPEQESLCGTLAELYLRLNQPQEAQAQYRLWLDLLEPAERWAQMQPLLSRLVELDPGQIAPRLRLAEIWVRLQRPAEAVSQFAEAARLALAQQREDEAARILERLCFVDPSQQAAQLQLARLCLARGEPKRALGPLQPCFRRTPQDLEVVQLMAQAFLALGHKQKATRVLHHLVGLLAAAGSSQQQALATARQQLAELIEVTGLPPPTAADAARTAADLRDPQVQATVDQVTFGPGEGDTSAAGETDRLLAEAESFCRLGLLEKGARTLRQILLDEPQHRGAQDRLIHVLGRSGERGEAAALLWQRIGAAQDSGDYSALTQDLVTLLEVEPQHAAALALRDSLLAAEAAALVGQPPIHGAEPA